MTGIVKVLYEEWNLRMPGETHRPPRGDSYTRGRGHGYGRKPPSTSPYSPSSSSSSTTKTLQSVHPHTTKESGKSPLLKIDVKFELPMYRGKNMNVVYTFMRNLFGKFHFLHNFTQLLESSAKLFLPLTLTA